MFEVGDEVLCRGEVGLDEALFAANIGIEVVVRIVCEDVLGIPIRLDEGTEEVVVIRIADGVALALVHVLCIGELRTRHDVDDALWDGLASVDVFVQVACEVIDLIFPEIGERTEEACEVTVEGRIADGGLRLVPVAGKAGAPCGGDRPEDAATAVARLHVLADEGGDRQMLTGSRSCPLNGDFAELFCRV